MKSREEKLLFFEDETYQWEELTQTFSWLEAMKTCLQDPIYHAEGNVWIHTGMVIEKLINFSSWKNFSKKEQSILFAACLLHDVAKPQCTIEENGKIRSPKHAKVGEHLTRQILTRFYKPFIFKEAICKLVRLHGLPLWFLDKPRMEKEVFRASLTVNTRLLTTVAEADIKGRICKDQSNLLERIILFKEYCQEQECYGRAKKFASDHTRFLYFRKDDVHPEGEIYDDTKFDVYLMCGIPGVGKDTWIQENQSGLPVVSLDTIRQHLKISFTDNQGKVLQQAQEEAKKWMRQQQSFVWNATNINRQVRKKLIDLFSSYGGRIIIVFLDKPLEVVLQQNRQRKVQIKEKVIYNFLKRLEPPDLTEAHQLIIA